MIKMVEDQSFDGEKKLKKNLVDGSPYCGGGED